MQRQETREVLEQSSARRRSVDTGSVVPAPQPGVCKLRFDGWLIWGLSSQIDVVEDGEAHWLTLAQCLALPTAPQLVVRHILVLI